MTHGTESAEQAGVCLIRYTTLLTTNSDLKRQQNEHADAMERVRTETQLFLKQKTDDILNMNNHIARLKKHLESLRLAAADEEAVKDSALQVTSQNTLEQGQVQLTHIPTQSSKLSIGTRHHSWQC